MSDNEFENPKHYTDGFGIQPLDYIIENEMDFLEGNIIKYNPGDFVLFDSYRLHKSQPIKKIPYWRTSVSYIIDKK